MTTATVTPVKMKLLNDSSAVIDAAWRAVKEIESLSGRRTKRDQRLLDNALAQLRYIIRKSTELNNAVDL